MLKKSNIKIDSRDPGVSTSIGTKAGDFLFLGSQTPADLETGRLVMDFRDLPSDAKKHLAHGVPVIDIPEERALTQTWRIYQNLSDILHEEGSSLRNIVHQRIFLKDMRDLASVEKVILMFMPDERPSTTILEATNTGVNEDIAVQLDAVALVNQQRIIKENISVSGLDHLTAPYPLATKAGQFIFTTPLAGVNPETGKLVNRFEELSPEEQKFTDQPYNAKEEALMTQHIVMWQHIRRILATQGAEEGFIHHNIWMRVPFRHFGPMAKVRKKLFAGQAHAVTGFFMSGTRREDAFFECGVVALIPPRDHSEYRKEIPADTNPLSAYYVDALKAGPFVFTSGIPSFAIAGGERLLSDKSKVRQVNQFSYTIDNLSCLDDEGRFLGYGRVHKENPIMAQAWYVYRQLKKSIAIYHSSMEDVVHQSVYMVNPADYPVVESVAKIFYGSKLPPTTVIPILAASPFPKVPLEIELVSLAPD